MIESQENDGALDLFLNEVPGLWYAYNLCMLSNGIYVCVRLIFGILLAFFEILGTRTLFWFGSYVFCWIGGMGGILITQTQAYKQFIELNKEDELVVTLDARFEFLFWSSIFSLMLLGCYCGCACLCAIMFGTCMLGKECCQPIAAKIDDMDGIQDNCPLC